MGIVNITPDSFSDGGKYLYPEQAIERCLTLIDDGADIIDIGGESTKPGAQPVSVKDELKRVLPVIEMLKQERDVVISIDTYKPEVMLKAAQSGASMINDVKALRSDGALAAAAKLDIPVCLMHMHGSPSTMQDNPTYQQPIIDEINAFFEERLHTCLAHGINPQHLIVDPGFGFGKSVQHNLTLLNEFNRFQRHGCPTLLGVSKKNTLGEIIKAPVDKRVIPGITMAIFAALNGMAIIRTHDVAETKQAFDTLEAIRMV